MRRLLGFALLGGAVALAAVGQATAAQNASISVSPSTVPPGGVVHISGSIPVQDCPASDAATVTSNAALFPPDGFGPNAPRNSQGDFAVDYTVPVTTPAGSYDVGARCGGGNVGVAATLRVTAGPLGGPATGAGGTAPGHGLPWQAAGVTLLGLAGIGLLVRGRLARRSR